MTNYLSNLGTDAILAILNQSNSATAIYTGDDLKIQLVNDSMLRIWGKNRSVHGKSFEEALPELKGQPFTKLLKNVWKTGEIYDSQSGSISLTV
ncbi:PAS domain-containing protein [Chryseobacterium indoltheticum]|uniref:PAS domain-containing protein n=1 Tax=Chryseobacterium indoltheticum TaxID=254 RepID=UPI0019117B99|nr:PAS domain-containing protein [Chryseobacterium indoltheticum]QQQ29088.1 PAS domain-containing protein [Chryseobacterium indoltheticum]